MFQTPCLEVVFFSYIFRKRNEISFLSVKIATGTMEENSLFTCIKYDTQVYDRNESNSKGYLMGVYFLPSFKARL